MDRVTVCDGRSGDQQRTLRGMSEEVWLREQARAYGLRVLQARHGKGWTQADLARATGEPYVSAPAISRIENGLADPLQSTTLRLSRALELEPHVLYGSQESQDALPLLSPTLAGLLRVFARLPESLQRYALQFLTELERQRQASDGDRSTNDPPNH